MDIFIKGMIWALESAMRRLEEEQMTEDDLRRLVYENFKRDKVILENLSINGLEYGEMNFEQFSEQVKNKKNILFLTDEELSMYKDALYNYDKLSRILYIIKENNNE